MHVDRSIRVMTPEEKKAKREWGTGACQVRGCTSRAAYLVLEDSPGEPESGEWWQYCCPKHAKHFADRHGLELPVRAGFARRAPASVRTAADTARCEPAAQAS